MSYSLSIVNDLTKLEILRIIRNKCREYMTGYTGEISKDQQQKWFSSLDKNKNIPFLFIKNDTKTSVGYGLIKCELDTCYLSAGLLEEYRGFGIGKFLFEALISECYKINCKSIQLQVLKTNKRAFNLYNKLNFKVFSEDNSKYFMELIDLK